MRRREFLATLTGCCFGGAELAEAQAAPRVGNSDVRYCRCVRVHSLASEYRALERETAEARLTCRRDPI